MVVATREVSGGPPCSKGGRWPFASQPLCGYGPPLLKLSPPWPSLAIWAPRTSCKPASQLELDAPSLELGGYRRPYEMGVQDPLLERCLPRW